MSAMHVAKGVNSGERRMAKAMAAPRFTPESPLKPMRYARPEHIMFARSNCLASLVSLPSKYSAGREVRRTKPNWKPSDSSNYVCCWSMLSNCSLMICLAGLKSNDSFVV